MLMFYIFYLVGTYLFLILFNYLKKKYDKHLVLLVITYYLLLIIIWAVTKNGQISNTQTECVYENYLYLLLYPCKL